MDVNITKSIDFEQSINIFDNIEIDVMLTLNSIHIHEEFKYYTMLRINRFLLTSVLKVYAKLKPYKQQSYVQKSQMHGFIKCVSFFLY